MKRYEWGSKVIIIKFIIKFAVYLEHYHSIINPMNSNIKFSREEEQDNKLPFLDFLVQKHGDGKINTSVYRDGTIP